MSILSQRTRHGKIIHLLSLDDLRDMVSGGTRLRAPCPIHGGDHQRSLSIDPESGWGYCHCCHATVLVQQLDRKRNGHAPPGTSLSCSSNGDVHAAIGRGYSYRHSQARLRNVPAPPGWQQEEQVALTHLASLLRASLLTYRRAQAYLDERGIPLALAEGSGIGYLSRVAWEQTAGTLAEAQQILLTRWIDRLLFPLHTPDGCGFIGRTLVGWQPGMDENAHKAVLEQPGLPRRWIKTNPAGWFGFAEPARLAETLILVEGGFDRLALLAAGLPAFSVVALVGTAARPAWLVQYAPQVKRVVLALDADTGGTTAMERLAQEFAQVGIETRCCPPPFDRWGKDWNERYRRLGPQSVYPLYEALMSCPAPRVSLAQPDASLPHVAVKGGDE